jgi:hypothetical protein
MVEPVGMRLHLAVDVEGERAKLVGAHPVDAQAAVTCVHLTLGMAITVPQQYTK